MIKLSHVAREVAANAAMGIPAVQAIRARRRRTTSNRLDEQVQQMRDQFDFFMATLGDVSGKVIYEIGPGDSVALGVQFLKAGAARYVAYDRFAGNIYGDYALQLYDRLGGQPDRSKIEVRGSIESVNPAVEESADAIISFDVLEHVSDPRLALENMADMLKPGGVMVHRVDYSPHDVWRSYDNPFTFLAFPEWLWKSMGSNRGYPNRVRHVELVRTLQGLGMQMDERVTQRFKPSHLAQLRDRLSGFQHYSEAEMMVLVAEFTACRERKVPLGPAFPY